MEFRHSLKREIQHSNCKWDDDTESTAPYSFQASSSSSIYLDKTKHKCQGHVGTYRHHSNMHDRVAIAVQ